jgi:predicted dehydrogenase
MTDGRRYAVVGTSARARMYINALARDYPGDIVAWCDPNPVRMSYYDEVLASAGRSAPARYQPDEFGALLGRERPDAVIVTSPDHTHPWYAAQALEAGCDAIIEKPVATSPEGARLLAEAARAAAGSVIITFNYRYSPRNSALRRVIAEGAIGKVTSVHFEWVLDTVHGADYFRRWHREKAASGGLLVHKASHHFDLVNWWIDDLPTDVYARAALRFYGDVNAKERGLTERPERSHGWPSLPTDPFSIDIAADDTLRRLYLEAEGEDGYIRDRDVFSGGITIEDNAAVLVSYASGAFLTYSLNAHSPWEGYRVSVNGDAGRAELEVVERGYVRSAADGSINGRPAIDPMTSDEADPGGLRPVGERLTVQRHWEPAYEVPIRSGAGHHGGGDRLLLDAVFRPGGVDPLRQQAGYADGLRAVAVGLAANRSMITGQAVNIRELGIPLE